MVALLLEQLPPEGMALLLACAEVLGEGVDRQ